MSTFTPNLKLEKPDGTDFVNIGLLNKNFDILDKLVPSDVADYPIEVGYDGTWRWEKWKSGKAVCWATKFVEARLNQAFGSVFIGTASQIDRLPYPKNFFVGLPNLQISYGTTSEGACDGFETSLYATKDYTNRIWLYRTTVGSLCTYSISLKATGRWKQ